MSDSQIKAAAIVLNKAMSNPPETHHHGGTDGGPITLAWPLPKNQLDL